MPARDPQEERRLQREGEAPSREVQIMFSFGPAFGAELAYQTERRHDAAGGRSHGRPTDGTAPDRRILELSPLSDIVALFERRQRVHEARRAARVAVRTPSIRMR